MLDPELSEDEPLATDRILRQFAGIWLVLFGGFAGWSAYQGHGARSVVLAVVAMIVGPLGLIRPGAIGPVFAILMTLTRPIGAVVTRIIVGIMFYGLFTPLALLFRLIGRDVLAVKRREGPGSYWTRRQTVADPRRYFRQ
jgi:hypothetical protein